MATASYSSLPSSNELQGTSLQSSETASGNDQESSEPEHPSASKNCEHGQRQRSSHHQHGSRDAVDHRIQQRISKIYKRLRETDANLKTMETLLGWKTQQDNYKKRQSVSKRSVSSHSSPERSVNQNTAYREQVRSIDNLQESGVSKSPTLEQLQRLTQSMQDLHNYQQRCHEDLKTEVQNINRSDHPDIHNLNDFMQQYRRDGSLSKDILTNLMALQNEMKTTQTNTYINPQIMSTIDNLRREMEDFKLSIAASSSSAPMDDNIVKRLSEIGAQQHKLEYMIEIMTKQIAESSHLKLSQKPENQEAYLQTQMEKMLKTFLETSKQVERLTAEVKHTRHKRRTNSSSTESDKDATKQKRIALQKLKNRCEILLNEKTHLEELYRIGEEKYHMMVQEKEILIMQLNDVQHKLRDTLKELQEIKDRLVEEQIHGIKKESNLQQCKTMLEEYQKNAAKHQEEFEKVKQSNEKLSIDNLRLSHQNEYLIREIDEHKERLQTTKTTLNDSSNASVEVLKESLKMLEIQSDTVKTELEKQLKREKESNKRLSDAISDLKIATGKEITDALKHKETEYEPIINILKQQISDYKTEVSNLHQENKNLAAEKSQVNKELLKVQSEVRDLHKQQKRLLKNFYAKDEELQIKVHQYSDLETNMADLGKVCRKMEQDYKIMLATINAEVDRTLQLWNKTSTYSLQAPVTSERHPIHPKVQLVDINSKLKWMQDEMCARLQLSNKLSKVGVHQELQCAVKNSQNMENTSMAQIHHSLLPETGNLTKTQDSRDATNLNIPTDCISSNRKQTQDVLSEEPKIYQSTKLKVHHSSDHDNDVMTNMKTKYKSKRLNSTEIESTAKQINERSFKKEIFEDDSCTTDSTPQLSSISAASDEE